MQFIRKVAVWLILFTYRISGLESLVDWADTRIFVYRKRLQMVPASFKVFVWLLGVAFGASSTAIYLQAPEIVQQITKASDPMVFVQTPKAEAAAVPVEEKVVEKPVDLVDVIFQKESSRGKNNYSKCEAQGKYNRYGYGIPGNGDHVCFEKDEDTKAVAGWVAHRKAMGWSDSEILCAYNTGKRQASCGYLK